MATVINTSEYKTYLNISVSTYDALLEDIVYGAEQEIKNYLGFDLASGTGEVELKDGNGSSRLHLDKFPVTAVSSVAKYEDDGSTYTALVDGTDYTRLTIIDQDHIYLDDYTFTEGVRNYKVTYNYGYTPLPMVIQLAMKKLVKYRWDEAFVGKNTLGVHSISNQGGVDLSVSVDKDEADRIFKTIEDYKRVNV